MFTRVEHLRDFDTAVETYVIPTTLFQGQKQLANDWQISMSLDEIRAKALNSVLLSMDRGSHDKPIKEYKTLKQLVHVVGPHLVSEDPQCRRNAIKLLGLVITRCPSLRTPSDVVESLVAFCAGRLVDWYSVEGAISIFSGLLEHHLDIVRWGSVEMDSSELLPDSEEQEESDSAYENVRTKSIDRFSCARIMLESILKRVHAPGFSQSVRRTILNVLTSILTEFPQDVRDAGPRIVTSICCEVENEKDPRNLMLTFPLMRLLLSDFDDLIKDDLQHCELISDVLLAYFPIRFQPPPNDPYGVTEADLCGSLRKCFVVNRRLDSHALDVILDVLNDGLSSCQSADVMESVETLTFCFPRFDIATLINHAEPFLEVIKLAAWRTPCQYVGSLAKCIAALISEILCKNESTTERRIDVMGCIRRILYQCVEHMAKPEMQPGCPGLISSRTVFLEVLNVSPVAATIGLEILLETSSPFLSIGEMLAEAQHHQLPSSASTSIAQAPLVEPPRTASWERITMDSEFLFRVIDCQRGLENPSHAVTSLLELLSVHSAVILVHTQVGGIALLKALCRCVLFLIESQPFNELLLQVHSILDFLAYIIGLPYKGKQNLPQWVEKWRSFLHQSMRLRGGKSPTRNDSQGAISSILVSMELMVTSSVVVRKIFIQLSIEYFQSFISDHLENFSYNLTTEDETQTELIFHIASSCISTAAFDNQMEVDAAALLAILYSIIIPASQLIKKNCNLLISLLTTLLQSVYRAIHPLVEKVTELPQDDQFSIQLMHLISEPVQVKEQFLALLSSSIKLIDDVSTLNHYLEQLLCLDGTSELDSMLILVPCIVPHFLSLSKQRNGVDVKLLERLQVACMSAACATDHYQPGGSEKANAARMSLACLALHGPQNFATSLLDSIKSQWQLSTNGVTLPLLRMLDLSISLGWILRAFWVRQVFDNIEPTISAFNALRHLIESEGMIATATCYPLLVAIILSVIFGPLEDITTFKFHEPPRKDLLAELPRIPKKEVLRLLDTIGLPLLSQGRTTTETDECGQNLYILFIILASLATEEIISLKDLDLSNSLILACSAAPLLHAGLESEDPNLGALHLQPYVDELDGAIVVVLFKLLEFDRKSGFVDALNDSVFVLVAFCIRQSTKNGIPWIRQTAGQCLVLLANTISLTGPVKHLVRSQITKGLRPALNDPSRDVRRTAALCCNLWSCQ